MRKFVLLTIMIGIFILACIYILTKIPKNNTITYIKIGNETSFILGVNKDNYILSYTNTSSKNNFNYNYFIDKSLDEALNVIKTKENIDNLSVTVITMNKEKQQYYYDLFRGNYVFTLNEPTNEELVNYSNEVYYDLNPYYTNDKLLEIINPSLEELNNSINKDLETINYEDLDNNLNTLKTKYESEYKLNINYENIELINSVITINFNKEEIIDNKKVSYNITYSYSINFKLKNNYESTLKDKVHEVIEEYDFTYSNNQITKPKMTFYSYTK